MAEFLFLLLICLAFVVVSVALAARYGVEALIIWDDYKNGHLGVSRQPPEDATPDEDDI